MIWKYFKEFMIIYIKFEGKYIGKYKLILFISVGFNNKK